MLSICSLQHKWVLGLMDKGWTAGDNNCDEQEPAISLPHNVGWFSLGFYNNSSTRYIQQQHQVLWLEYSACFLPLLIFGQWGREGHQLQGTRLSSLCDLMDGVSQVTYVA